MAKEKSMSFIEMFQKKAEETPAKQDFKIFSFNTKEGEKKKIRFISDFNEPVILQMHENWNPALGQNGGSDFQFPCLKQFGKECPMCDKWQDDKSMKEYRPRGKYVWTVQEYEYDSKLFWMMSDAPQAKTVIPYLIDLLTDEDEDVADLRKHDITVKQVGKGTAKSFVVKAGKEEDVLDGEPYSKVEVLDLLKQGTFTFNLPEWIDFDELKDIDSEDDMPF